LEGSTVGVERKHPILEKQARPQPAVSLKWRRTEERTFGATSGGDVADIKWRAVETQCNPYSEESKKKRGGSKKNGGGVGRMHKLKLCAIS